MFDLRPIAQFSLLAALAWTSVACGGARPTPVRFVTATADEIQNTAGHNQVWFEVQEGDEVPLHFIFQGVTEGVNEVPLVLKAKKKFYFVSQKDGRFFFSFDGEHVAADAGRFTVALIPGPPSNKAGLLVYLGPLADMQATLAALEANAASASSNEEGAAYEGPEAEGAAESEAE